MTVIFCCKSEVSDTFLLCTVLFSLNAVSDVQLDFPRLFRQFFLKALQFLWMNFITGMNRISKIINKST